MNSFRIGSWVIWRGRDEGTGVIGIEWEPGSHDFWLRCGKFAIGAFRVDDSKEG